MDRAELLCMMLAGDPLLFVMENVENYEMTLFQQKFFSNVCSLECLLCKREMVGIGPRNCITCDKVCLLSDLERYGEELLSDSTETVPVNKVKLGLYSRQVKRDNFPA